MAGALFLFAYACSGLAALVYEVSWTRVLTLTMGRGVAASSTVLAAYMGGLALGAGIAGRRAALLSARDALRTYAGLELAAALFAVAVPFELHLFEPLLSAAYRDGDAGFMFGMVRLVVSLALVTIPALALGATFPVAVRGFAAEGAGAGVRAGWLYVVNTVGAAFGAFLAGFVLVPAIGVTGALAVGCAASLAAALVAFRMSQAVAEEQPAPHVAVTPSADGDKRRGGPQTRAKGSKRHPSLERQRSVPIEASRLAPTVFALTVSGAVILAAEVIWSRIVSLLVGPSTYAFAATVATFIGGLAIGGTISASVSARLRRPLWLMAVMMGLASLASAWAAQTAGVRLPHDLMIEFSSAAGLSPVMRSLRVAFVVLPFAVLVGGIFPAGLLTLGSAQASTKVIGLVYAANAVASVAGSLLAGFLMVPVLGLERSLSVITIVLAAVSVIILVWGSTEWTWRIAGALPVVAAAVLVYGGQVWDRDILVTGAYKYAASIPAGSDVETALRAGTLEYYRDGASATVTVKRLTGTLSLAIDGKVDASSGGDMLTQKLLAQLPLLMHGAARQVGIIGLGSGITLASALTHPIEHVDVLEISPEVVEASRLFFENGKSPLDDARTRVLVTDGRTHLSLSARQYDVLISEPSNPWMAGVAALFTREFFEAARERLTPGGVICQWVNTYDISGDDLRSVVGTFASVFPHVTLWLAGDGDLLIVGSSAPSESRLDALATSSVHAAVRADLASAGVTSPFGLLSLYVGGEAEVRRFAASAVEQRDDRMALEFSAPKALRTDARSENVKALRELVVPESRPAVVARAWEQASAADHAQRARVLKQAGSWAAAFDAARTALRLTPDHADALDALIDACVPLRREAEATTLLRTIVDQQPALIQPRIALSKLLAATGAIQPAIDAARAAVDQDPNSGAALEQLASIFSDVGDSAQLAPLVGALQRFPDRAGSSYYLAAQHFMHGELEQALAAIARALTVDPRFARAQNLKGAILATKGDTAGARTAFESALSLDPRDPATYQNLATLELSSGNASKAASLFAEALSLDPGSDVARQGLARARVAL